MTITRLQHEAAYRVALEFHDSRGALSITNAMKLLQPTGLNSSSATGFIYIVGHMLRGECYKWQMSVPATDDYLTWIRRDHGDVALKNALDALKQHLDYRKEQKGLKMKGLRKVLADHQARLTNPAEALLILTWMDRESAGFTDEFPLDWFVDGVTLKKKQHAVRDPRGNTFRAYCDIRVREKIVELDYEPYSKENARDKMLLGVIRLRFEDDDLRSLAGVEWKPKSSVNFIPTAYSSPKFSLPTEPNYIPPTKPAAKVERLVRERPGQAAFRRKLKSAYNNQCCISGCTVTEALEGAHIDPYIAESSDNIRNGLLLRSDLHTLFDRHLIAINPDTMIVHVAKRARGGAGYEQWHGRSIKLPSEPTHKPDAGALCRHWHKLECPEKSPDAASISGKATCYDLSRDLAGSLKGFHRDLATNPKRMESFGR